MGRKGKNIKIYLCYGFVTLRCMVLVRLNSQYYRMVSEYDLKKDSIYSCIRLFDGFLSLRGAHSLSRRDLASPSGRIQTEIEKQEGQGKFRAERQEPSHTLNDVHGWGS